MSKKPKPMSDGPLKAYARRAPTAADPRWYWQVVHHEDGQQHPVPGASGRYTPAEVRALLRARLAAGDWRVEAAPKVVEQTWKTLLDLYVEYHQARTERERIRPATMIQHTYNRRRVSDLNARPIGAPLTLAVAEELIEDLEDQGYAPLTIRLTWKWLAGAIRWGQQRGYLPPQVIPVPELPAAERRRARITPSDSEARRVIGLLPDDWRRVAGWILLGTGCRTGELAHAGWGDWRPDEGANGVLHVDGKTGPRAIWVGAETRAVVEGWWERCGRPVDGPLLGVAVLTVVGMTDVQLPAACRAAGVPAWGCYALRRLASTRLIGEGIDAAAYQAQMGHSHALALATYAGTLPTRRSEAATILDTPAAGRVISLDEARARRA